MEAEALERREAKPIRGQIRAGRKPPQFSAPWQIPPSWVPRPALHSQLQAHWPCTSLGLLAAPEGAGDFRPGCQGPSYVGPLHNSEGLRRLS